MDVQYEHSDPSACATPVSDTYISKKMHKFSPACVHLDANNYDYDYDLCLFLS